MQCPICRADNSPDAKFCNQCAAGLQPTLSPPDSKSEPTKATLASLNAERKVVTALFSDLTGYTAMSERLDPSR